MTVAVLGTAMAVGLVEPDRSLLLTALPAALAVAVIALVLAIPRLGSGRDPGLDASRLRRAVVAVRRAVIGGTAEAVEIVRSRNLTVIAGAIGYWAFDNAVLWATFEAVGADVPISIVARGDRGAGGRMVLVPSRCLRPPWEKDGRSSREAGLHALQPGSRATTMPCS